MTTITYHGRKIRLDDDMLRLLEWALKRPGRWVQIADEMAAVRRLEAAGLVEVFEVANMYRVDEKALAKTIPGSAVAEPPPSWDTPVGEGGDGAGSAAAGVGRPKSYTKPASSGKAARGGRPPGAGRGK